MKNLMKRGPQTMRDVAQLIDVAERRRSQKHTAKLVPRGLRRSDAAAYVGVSPTKFDDWVSRRVMPAPKRIDGVVIWDRHTLVEAFAELPDGTTNTDDDVWNNVSA